MTESTRSPITPEEVKAVLARFNFGDYAKDHWFDEDEHFLVRLVGRLKSDIDKALPALQPDSAIECGWDRLTAAEREYSRNFFYLESESLFLPLMRKGWGIRRLHRGMVEMLRALIALDPESLAEYDVVVPSEEVSKVEVGDATAESVVSSELNRLSRNKTEGHMLRYGIYLGLAMAQAGKSDLAHLARRLAEEVGANDPLERPDYRMDDRSAEFLREMRAQQKTTVL
jgi:hypothetical protein